MSTQYTHDATIPKQQRPPSRRPPLGGIPWFSMAGAALTTLAANCFRRVSSACRVFQFGFVDLLFAAYAQGKTLLLAACNSLM
jgi:hypothetical protein